MRLYDNVPFGRAAHLERMVVSARNLRLNLDVEAIARDIEACSPPPVPGTRWCGFSQRAAAAASS